MNICPVATDTARYLAAKDTEEAEREAKAAAKLSAIENAVTNKTAFFKAYRNLLENSEDFATCLIERHWAEQYGKDSVPYVRSNLAVHEHIDEELGRMWDRGAL